MSPMANLFRDAKAMLANGSWACIDVYGISMWVCGYRNGSHEALHLKDGYGRRWILYSDGRLALLPRDKQ